MAEIPNRAIYSQTDSSNTGALPGLTGASSPALIDDAIRADMGATAREYDWRTYAGTVGGSANAYTLTYTVAPAAYYNPMRFTFVANFAVTGSATLNVNSLGAKTIKKLVAGVKTNLASGDISSGDYVEVVYDGTDFVWVNRGAASSAYTVNAQTAETAVDTADFVGGYDTSGTAERKFSVNNLHKAVNTFTAETAVAVDDVVGLYDTSASTMDKATVEDVFEAINGLTEDTSPDKSADFVLTYDTSAGGVKKVKPNNLSSGPTRVYKTANESVTSSTTLQDDDHLTFSIAANTNYVGEFHLFVEDSTSTSGGLKLQLTGPASPTLVRGFAHTMTSGQTPSLTFFSSFSSSVNVTAENSNNHHKVVVHFLIQNGANAGTVTLQWAQISSTGTATTIYASSYVEYAVAA